MIREADQKDWVELMRLYRQLNSDEAVFADGRDRAVFEQILGQDGLFLFVLESAGKLVSTCYLNVIPNLTRSAMPYAVIENVVTYEARRGRGFGKRVIEHAVLQAWALGCYKVMLMTGSKEESTHAFYRSCGFSAKEKQAYVIRQP
ncbi:MAG: GNAT superfamily N-acetyltransferase [Cellvibrionaceae bacterium]|jgi:GNAT superfamily N-acetyltransferase